MFPYWLFRRISDLSSPCSQILKMLQTQKSSNEQHKMGHISRMIVNYSTGLIFLNSDIIGAYDLTSNTTSFVELILTAGFEYT